METPLSAKAALLQALAAPGYGLDLLARVRRQSAGLIRLRPGSVYPALRALEQEGLAAVRPGQAGGRRGRPRRYYELTLRGVQLAMAQRAALLELLGGPGVTATPDVREMRRHLESCSSLSASVLDLEDLLRLKLKAGGPKDLMDVAALVLRHPRLRPKAKTLALAFGLSDALAGWLADPRLKAEIRGTKGERALKRLAGKMRPPDQASRGRR